jgi:dTDP-glucose pyrophosphorylase
MSTDRPDGAQVCELHEFLVSPSLPIGECLAALDRNAAGILLVVDEDMTLLGTITDGDVRRGLLRGLTFDDTATDVMHRKPIKMPEGMSRDQLITLMTANGIRHIPIVDDRGRVTDLTLLTDLVKPQDLGIAALIMAGGEGRRLRPFTYRTPKPLLAVGDKPIIEHTIELLCSSGIRDIYVSTCYLAERLERSLGDGARWGIRIAYLREVEPRGTAGALHLLPAAPSDPILVINGDLLTQIDVAAMLDYHRSHAADLTIAVREYQVQIPFGVVKVAPNNLVKRIEEKPLERYFVNAGIYLVGASILDSLPGEDSLPMTKLISDVLASDGRVAAFPMVESWVDVGRPSDFERAQNVVAMRSPFSPE